MNLKISDFIHEQKYSSLMLSAFITTRGGKK